MSRSEYLQECHNLGQEDGSKEEAASFIGHFSSEERRAYFDGYYHALGQKHYGEGEYNGRFIGPGFVEHLVDSSEAEANLAAYNDGYNSAANVAEYAKSELPSTPENTNRKSPLTERDEERLETRSSGGRGSGPGDFTWHTMAQWGVMAVGAYFLYLYLWDLGIERIASMTGLSKYKRDGFDSGNLLFLILVAMGLLALYRLQWAGAFGCLVLATMFFAPGNPAVKEATPRRQQTPNPQQSSLPQSPQPPQMRFAPVLLPNLSPPPSYLGRHPTNGDLIFDWGGRRWLLPDIHKPYRYYCVVAGQLQWCWPNPPNPSAVACRHEIDKTQGWCWRN
jgi:hypothetical protein